ncbi:hypothetical protein SAMN04488005_1658 [Yoonia tamlensis]|uniref:DUF7742 domain-containing protein n=1 Tax=Yoonia tamlensis TaxID=390270 RepID=A0A1I6GH67_9RHOB|nr:hypothetical protein [Yoonia tamlensis]SFR41526.1 hypothetical protein SAMN04488005_1658 [Yoonia tamlensis]
MRPVQLADLEIAARVVAAQPAPARRAMVKLLCDQADMADIYRLGCGLAHPKFGTGTLMSAAMKHPQPVKPATSEPAFLTSLALLCAHLGGITPVDM